MVCLVAVVSFVPGCEEAPTAQGSKAERPGPVQVVTTVGMIGDVAQKIAGEKASVRALMGAGVDPHLYKPSPGDVRLLSGADLILYNGLSLEGKMGDVLVKLARERAVVAVAERVPHERLLSPPEFDGHEDPHIWHDVSLWALATERARDALIEADPVNRGVYEANHAALAARLGELHTWAQAQIGGIPAERRVLVTAHDAFGYFGRAYGLEVHGIQGISTESEASLRDINGLVDLLVSRRVPAVFVESSVPRKAVDALVEGCRSRGHELRIGGELYSDALGAPGTPEGTYEGMIRHNVTTIVEALR